MTRQTSIEAYRKIEASGVLSRRKWQVYSTLFHHGPMTATECLDFMQENGISISSQSHTRFTELRRAGVLYEVQTRKCKKTGENVVEWDVTDRFPIKVKAPKGKVARLRAENKALRERIGELEAKVRELTPKKKRQPVPRQMTFNEVMGQ